MKQEERNIRAAFYIPFAYLYCVRLRSVTKMMSWLLLYILPTAFYSGLNAWTYILILAATFSLYELGYIFNDTQAVQRETNPSLRLSETETNYFFAHRGWIIACRLIIAVGALSILSFLHSFTPSFLIISLALMCLLFAIYNRWRNTYNVFLYVWLVFSRYLPFMCLSSHPLSVYILLFVSYPLLIGIERFSMPAYRWRFIRALIPTEQAKAPFRAAYYMMVLLILLPCCYFAPIAYYDLIPIGVLALYRIVRLVKKE